MLHWFMVFVLHMEFPPYSESKQFSRAFSSKITSSQNVNDLKKNLKFSTQYAFLLCLQMRSFVRINISIIVTLIDNNKYIKAPKKHLSWKNTANYNNTTQLKPKLQVLCSTIARSYSIDANLKPVFLSICFQNQG